MATSEFGQRRILFYKEAEAYYQFSNFFKCKPFRLHYWEDLQSGNTRSNPPEWTCTEAYYQANKFWPHAKELARPIQEDGTPSFAFRAGRKCTENKNRMRPDWEEVKEEVMLAGLRAKFADLALREVLLSTEDATIVEHTKRDAYWGDGGDGSGRNRLGHCLMVVREEIRRAAALPAASASSGAKAAPTEAEAGAEAPAAAPAAASRSCRLPPAARGP